MAATANLAWRRLDYGSALRQVRAAAAWLLEHDISVTRPLVVLSDNSIDHGVMMLAAMAVGIPVAPVSPAYSLMSSDHGRLKAIIRLLEPGAIFVANPRPFAAALTAIAPLHQAILIAGSGQQNDTTLAGLQSNGRVTTIDELVGFEPSDAGAARSLAEQAVGPDTMAKILFTSGSTGTADHIKGVINTQRMLCVSQQAKAQLWPFLDRSAPVIVDWLPWNHTFGGNHNFNLVLRNGGTLYIDGGKPMPGLFATTLANLAEVAPTIYFNVPRGYDLLVQALRQDDRLRDHFFSRLQVLFYAAAALPRTTWDALKDLSIAATGRPIAMVSAWGATETSPLATDCHFQAAQTGVIGLPIPGTELKLVPNAGKFEIRVRGPNVMPGYFKAPQLTREVFDDEGYYRIGDAVRMVDDSNPTQGLLFDGRVSEDFKLSSGTWVNVGMLRIRAIEALSPLAQDIVICGHDRDTIGLLVFPNLDACRAIVERAMSSTADGSAAGPASATGGDQAKALLTDPAVKHHLQAGLERLREQSGGSGGSASHASRALLLTDPPSIDAGEITDKGYINQRAVLACRLAQVTALYDNADDVVLLPAAGADH